MFGNKFMEIAYKTSLKCIKSGDIPVGCVIVSQGGEILAKAKNTVYKDKLVCNHAEINAIKYASKKLNSRLLIGCSMYITLEPCAMCAYAICLARIENLYIGTTEPKTGAIISNLKIFDSAICNHRPNVYYGFMCEEISQLLKTFFQEKR